LRCTNRWSRAILRREEHWCSAIRSAAATAPGAKHHGSRQSTYNTNANQRWNYFAKPT
jgi:hypothetical protein